MMPGEIYWVDFHDSGSRGQAGKRPAIVLQDDTRFPVVSPMVVVVPLTTKTAATRFPATLRIDPSAANGLTAPSIALVFQIRAVDRTWVDGKLRDLEPEVLD
jgi:mRNA interferase MazF